MNPKNLKMSSPKKNPIQNQVIQKQPPALKNPKNLKIRTAKTTLTALTDQMIVQFQVIRMMQTIAAQAKTILT
jgi:hypothetical protein